MRGTTTRYKVGTGILVSLGIVAGVVLGAWYAMCEIGTGGECWLYVRQSLF